MRCVAAAAAPWWEGVACKFLIQEWPRKVTPAAGSQQTPVHITGVLGWGVGTGARPAGRASKLMPGRRLAVPLQLLSLTRCGVAINDQSVSTLATHCRQQASTVLLNWENYALLLLPTNTADRNSSFYTADAGISKKFEDPLTIHSRDFCSKESPQFPSGALEATSSSSSPAECSSSLALLLSADCRGRAGGGRPS